MNKAIPILISFFISSLVHAQELNARVTVSAVQVTNNVNRNAFQTLQTALNNFIRLTFHPLLISRMMILILNT